MPATLALTEIESSVGLHRERGHLLCVERPTEHGDREHEVELPGPQLGGGGRVAVEHHVVSVAHEVGGRAHRLQHMGRLHRLRELLQLAVVQHQLHRRRRLRHHLGDSIEGVANPHASTTMLQGVSEPFARRRSKLRCHIFIYMQIQRRKRIVQFYIA